MPAQELFVNAPVHNGLFDFSISPSLSSLHLSTARIIFFFGSVRANANV